MKVEKDFNRLTAMELYFLYLDESEFIIALEGFSRLEGYSVSEFIISAFPSEYESWEEGYFGNNGIKFEVEPPAVDDDKYEIVENKDFIKFLETMVEEYLTKFPSDKTKVEQILEKIKIALA